MTVCQFGPRAIVLAATLLVAAPRAEQFRATSNAVLVDVAVESRNRPVDGLTDADFRVTDNGMPQHVSVLAHGTVPLRLTLVIDISGSVSGPLPDGSELTRLLQERLGPQDAVEVITIADGPHLAVPLTNSPPATIPLARAIGGSPIRDTLVHALLLPTPAGARRVIVVVTDGDDRRSVTTPQELRQLAARSEARLFALLETSQAVPFSPTEIAEGARTIEAVAAATGGQTFRYRRLEPALRDLLARVSRGYVLAYTPQGPPTPGWHEIDVQVTRPGRYSIGARRGYFVPAPAR